MAATMLIPLLVIALLAFVFLRPQGKPILKPGVAADEFFGGRSRLDSVPIVARGNPIALAVAALVIGGGLAVAALQDTVLPILSRVAGDIFGQPAVEEEPAAEATMPATDPAAPETAPEAAAAGNLPDTFNYAEARDALLGVPSAVDRAFNWASTAQGHEFWQRENDTVNAGGSLSGEARAVLQSWMDAARREAGPLPENFFAEEARAALSGGEGAVDRAFTWSTSAQGSDFWSAENGRVNSGAGLTPPARRILLTWLGTAESP